MRWKIPAVVLLLSAGAIGLAVAQEAGPSVSTDQPTADSDAIVDENGLDTLFETLRTTESQREARRTEAAITEIWLESGSATVDVLMNWSLEAMQKKNYALALDFLDRVTIMKPNYAEGWNKRATVHFMLDDYSRSLADISRVLELEPRHFGALSGLGMILRSVGDDERARAAFRQALDLDPFLSDVREALEELEAETFGEQT